MFMNPALLPYPFSAFASASVTVFPRYNFSKAESLTIRATVKMIAAYKILWVESAQRLQASQFRCAEMTQLSLRERPTEIESQEPNQTPVVDTTCQLTAFSLWELKRKRTLEEKLRNLRTFFVEVGFSIPWDDVALRTDFERLS
jgi:hypothetical protein